MEGNECDKKSSKKIVLKITMFLTICFPILVVVITTSHTSSLGF
jgi:hypothetical protein